MSRERDLHLGTRRDLSLLKVFCLIYSLTILYSLLLSLSLISLMECTLIVTLSDLLTVVVLLYSCPIVWTHSSEGGGRGRGEY